MFKMNRIRELREKFGLTGPQLAKMLNISPQHLYDIEKERRRMHDDMIRKITKMFDVSADWLLGLDENCTDHNGGDDQKMGPPIEEGTLAAHRTDDPMNDLPEEARRSLEEFKEFILKKYGKK